MYEDEKLICEDCGSEFTFTVGEQEFYAEKGLVTNQNAAPNAEKQEDKRTERKCMK